MKLLIRRTFLNTASTGIGWYSIPNQYNVFEPFLLDDTPECSGYETATAGVTTVMQRSTILVLFYFFCCLNQTIRILNFNSKFHYMQHNPADYNVILVSRGLLPFLLVSIHISLLQFDPPFPTFIS